MNSSVLLIAVGSRGDNEPLLALSSHLLSYAPTLHVHLALSPDYVSNASENERLHLHAIPEFSISSFHAAMAKHYDPSNQKKRTGLKSQLAAMGAITEYCVLPSLSKLSAIVESEMENPVAIVCTTLAMTISKCLVDIHSGLKCFSIHFQPNTQTSYYPCYLSSNEEAIEVAQILTSSSESNRNIIKSTDDFFQSHDALLVFFNDSLESTNKIRRESYNLFDDISIDDVRLMFKGRIKNMHVIHSYMHLLHPRGIPDLHKLENLHVVPPLAHTYIPDDWDPKIDCPSILKLIEDCEKEKIRLICASVGSMRVSEDQRASIASEMAAAFQTFDKDAKILLLSGGQLKNPKDKWWMSHVFEFQPESVQFSWLFPYCNLVLCHGGAGVVAAAAAAGVPCIVAPVMCDQWMWTAVVSNTKLGAPIWKGLHDISKEDLEIALKQVDSIECRKACKTYHEKVEMEGKHLGCSRITDLILR